MNFSTDCLTMWSRHKPYIDLFRDEIQVSFYWQTQNGIIGLSFAAWSYMSQLFKLLVVLFLLWVLLFSAFLLLGSSALYLEVFLFAFKEKFPTWFFWLSRLWVWRVSQEFYVFWAYINAKVFVLGRANKLTSQSEPAPTSTSCRMDEGMGTEKNFSVAFMFHS